MIVGSRIKARIDATGLNQSELARRVGITQPAINALIRGSSRTSLSLHKIARELGTTPSYLSGETDDPNADAPEVPPLDPDARELVDHFGGLSAADRRALLQVARSMASGPHAEATVHSATEPFAHDEAHR